MTSQIDARATEALLALSGGKACVEEPIPVYHGIGEEEKAAVMAFFDKRIPLSGFHGSPRPSFFGGPEVLAFEAAWKAKFGCRHAVSMNSATSALFAAMGAIGISPGDEVIVPPYTMSATAIAPLVYGGIPVFAEIEDQYFCLDVTQVQKKISSRTKAIIAVNLWGHPAQLSELRALCDENSIYLIEDNAQAILSREKGVYTGNIGHIGIFSMNIHKHIQAGEGGVCTTADDDLAARLCMIRNHGENVVDWLKHDNLANVWGFNFRQTEIGAVISRIQLQKLEQRVARCVDISERLTQGIAGLKGIYAPKVRPGCTHSYYMWSARFNEKEVGCSRKRFCEALKAEGVPIAEGYVAPLYRLPVFQKKIAIGDQGWPFNLTRADYRDGLCPVTERLHENEIIQ
ncbi:MAG: DegT/DnrJ/EryC1/StrS family aminotransferase, partial [Alphaproteobacteria bacterium]|nr:DegT/DnrJ/EryC1/StrS family aminotransferase [Alphaproteobacteria bacterium]